MMLNKLARVLVCFALIGLLSACSETRYAAHVVKQIPMPGDTPRSQGTYKVGKPYYIKGQAYHPQEKYNHVETGVASWYGPGFHGKKTANGEIFNKHELTAAHRTLQMPSIIRVTNLANGRSAILRVNDRGPFAHDRVLDVSERAATMLGFKHHGTTRVKIEVLEEESRQVAMAAKSGRDTRGFEVALNQRGRSTPVTSAPLPQQKAIVNTQQVATINNSPVPIRKPMAVSASRIPIPAGLPENIYVQAGSFALEKNALDYSNKLANLGPSKVYLTQINEQPYFRVRLGPYGSREQASRILTALNESGNKNAVIVID